EREFGVPFPGRVLDPSKWTRTALKAMPVEGRLDWKELFGRSAPVVLDLGCGNGRFLIGSALHRAHPDPPGPRVLPGVIRSARHPAGRHPLRPQAGQPAGALERPVRGTRGPRTAGALRRAALGRRGLLLPPAAVLRSGPGPPPADHPGVRRPRPPAPGARRAVRRADRQLRLLEVRP